MARYPLEWGWDTPAEPDAPALPTFRPVRQTLLGGADPASFPRAPGITPVSTGDQTQLAFDRKQFPEIP